MVHEINPMKVWDNCKVKSKQRSWDCRVTTIVLHFSVFFLLWSHANNKFAITSLPLLLAGKRLQFFMHFIAGLFYVTSQKTCCKICWQQIAFTAIKCLMSMLLHQLARQSASRLTITNRKRFLHDARRYEVRSTWFGGRVVKLRHAIIISVIEHWSSSIGRSRCFDTFYTFSTLDSNFKEKFRRTNLIKTWLD